MIQIDDSLFFLLCADTLDNYEVKPIFRRNGVEIN